MVLALVGRAAAAEPAPPYLGNMLLAKGTKVEIISTQVNIKITGSQALVTSEYQLANRGENQTLTVYYPAGSRSQTPLITGLAITKNSQHLSVKKQTIIREQGSWAGVKTDYYTYSFPLAKGESCTLHQSYFAALPVDQGWGRLIHYDNHTTGGWIDQGLKKIDISISDFKPYFNVMLFAEESAPPQKMNYQGNFSYLIDPGVKRQDVKIYYQLRGPEAAQQRLALSRLGSSLPALIRSGSYLAARQQLLLLAPQLLSEGIVTSYDLTMLQVYLAYEQQEYKLVAEELGRLTIKDGAYIYYHIINSLKLNNQNAAGESFRIIGQFEQQDLTGVSVGLLKNWAEANISKYLSRPAAPVPPVAESDRPRRHTAVLLATMGLIVLASILTTIWMRRKKPC